MSKQGPIFYAHFANGGHRSDRQQDDYVKRMGEDLITIKRNRRERRAAGNRGMFLEARPKVCRDARADRPRASVIARRERRAGR